jgi:putative transposase
MSRPSPFRTFKTSPEIVRPAVMLYILFPLSLRNVEDLLHERGIDFSHCMENRTAALKEWRGLCAA